MKAICLTSAFQFGKYGHDTYNYYRARLERQLNLSMGLVLKAHFMVPSTSQVPQDGF